jgi:hypothetical protein
MSVDDPAIEAALEAALGLSDRGASAPMNQIAIGSALAAVAILFGLVLARQLPQPSTVAADPAFVVADQAARQADEARYLRHVEDIRLREIGFQRDEDENFGGEGVKSFPTLPEGDQTHAGAKVFGLIPPEGER